MKLLLLLCVDTIEFRYSSAFVPLVRAACCETNVIVVDYDTAYCY
jgi:hypothetical protein